MNIVFFCENLNQVYISKEIFDRIYSLTPANVEILLLDWQKETAEWVFSAVRELQWDVPVTNIFDSASDVLKNQLVGSEDKTHNLREMSFSFLKKYMFSSDTIIVQYNDASRRGRSIAHVCRNSSINRALIQDGFLNFVSKSGNLKTTDQNYYWGWSHPEISAVWGDKTKEMVLSRHNNNPESVYVIGSIKTDLTIPNLVVHKPSRGKIKVLWADQAIIDQAKADTSRWLEEYQAIADQLSNFDTTVRFHPSTTKRVSHMLTQIIGDKIKIDIPNSPKLDKEYIKNFDVVVTYYSTTFLDCLSAQIPCVFFRASPLDIQFPYISHPLLTYCEKSGDISTIVSKASQVEVSDAAADDIFKYIYSNEGCSVASRLIVNFLSGKRDSSSFRLSDHLHDVRVFENINRLAGKNILVLGGGFGNHVGVGKPIHTFCDSLKGLDINVEYYLVSKTSRVDLFNKVSLSSIIIINSFDVVRDMSEFSMKKIIAISALMHKPVIFYCHETEYAFLRMAEAVGGRADTFVNNILPKIPVLAVGNMQANWLASLGAKHIRVVYNAPPHLNNHCVSLESDRKIILMVGSQQKRKGIELFSRVADIVCSSGLNWEFVWLGGYTKAAEGCYRSDNVQWKGHVSQEEVHSYMVSASVFFLSSVDEPVGLCVVEALNNDLPCLVYKKVGIANFIKLNNFGEVFDIYDPHEAYKLLIKMASHKGEYKISKNIVSEIFDIKNFSIRMLVAIGEIFIGYKRERDTSKFLSPASALKKIDYNEKPNSTLPPLGVKKKILIFLSKNLPSFIVKPGGILLKWLRVI